MPTGPRTITIIRHGEKPPVVPTQPPFGLDAEGAQNHSSLTPIGWQRAHALADLLAGEPLRPPFARPSLLIAPAYGSGEAERRPYQTLMPTSARLALPILTPFAEDHEPELAALLLEQEAADVLVCWEHHRIPGIVAPLASALGIATLPANGQAWPDEDFWSALVFRPDASGTGYAVVLASEALLPGDPPAG